MPITRQEKLLNTLATGVASGVEPITREEQYLAYIAGETATKPDAPITRKEVFLDRVPQGGGGGGGVTIKNQNKTITENGTYTADSGYTGLGTVTVSVAPPPSDIDKFIDRSITEVSGSVTSVGEYAFNSCSKLTSVNFPLATRIGGRAFNICEKLSGVNIPSATEIGDYAFNKCKSLTDVNFPLVTKVGNNAFSECINLTSINFPLISGTLGNSSFAACKNLTSVNFPLIDYIGRSAFSGCNNLTSVDFQSAKKIESSAFETCYMLTRIALRSTTVCTLANVSAFKSCYHLHGTVHTTYNPDGLKDGYIYVPSALIEDYKVATNWSTFADQFRALEDYTVDGTTTGALDESKI